MFDPKRLLLLVTSLFISAPSLAISDLEELSESAIEFPFGEDHCKRIAVTQPTLIHLGEEEIEMNPFCAHPFRQEFDLSDGTQCVAEGGMCSRFRPRERFRFECTDGRSDERFVRCPVNPQMRVSGNCRNGFGAIHVRARLKGDWYFFSANCGSYTVRYRYIRSEDPHYTDVCVFETRACSGNRHTDTVRIVCQSNRGGPREMDRANIFCR